jgi:hypothetical protein
MLKSILLSGLSVQTGADHDSQSIGAPLILSSYVSRPSYLLSRCITLYHSCHSTGWEEALISHSQISGNISGIQRRARQFMLAFYPRLSSVIVDS